MMSGSGITGLAVALFWFLATVAYFWGLFVTSKALTYITTHYRLPILSMFLPFRGYDDVDPDRVQFIEQMLRNMIDEIKQRELDIASGALLSETNPTGEAEAEITARSAPEGGRTPSFSKGKRHGATGSVMIVESLQSDE
ncbi:hypothetical protein OSTOST_09333 [Ostertagia ostertagi]